MGKTFIIVTVIWAIAAAALCGIAFLLLVGQAFSRRDRRSQRAFANFILGPGLKIARGRPVVAIVCAWAMWTCIGALAISGVLIMYLNRR